MSGLLEQISLAKDKLHELYPDMDLVPVPKRPIFLSDDSWQIPYSLYYQLPYGAFRLRQAMLMLFFEQSAQEPLLEWSELSKPCAANNQKTRADALNTFVKSKWGSSASFTTFHDTLVSALKDQVQRNKNVKELCSIEMVLDDSGAASEWLPCWRIGFIQTDSVYGLGIVEPQAPYPIRWIVPSLKQRAREGWIIGDTERYNNASLRTWIPDTNANKEKIRRAKLMTQACLCAAEDLFQNCGYTDIGLDTVKVQYLHSVASGGYAQLVEDTPVITMGYDDLFAESPDMFFHELGHAVWWLFYARLPACINRNIPDVTTWSDGIQEGFADFFAATLLTEYGNPRVIGGYLPKETAAKYRLPRIVSAADCQRPEQAELQNDKPAYTIGNRWANLLWNLREHLEKAGKGIYEITRLVLNAHVRPPHNLSEPDIWDCYVQSICETAKSMGIDLSGWSGCS